MIRSQSLQYAAQLISSRKPRNPHCSQCSKRAPTKNAVAATGMELSRSTAKAKRACADKGYVADPFASLALRGRRGRRSALASRLLRAPPRRRRGAAKLCEVAPAGPDRRVRRGFRWQLLEVERRRAVNAPILKWIRTWSWRRSSV